MDAGRMKQFALDHGPLLVIGGAIGIGFDSLALALGCAFTTGIAMSFAAFWMDRR